MQRIDCPLRAKTYLLSSSFPVFVPPCKSSEMAGARSQSQQLINESIDAVDEQLRAINKIIHANPELGYQEFKAHDNVAKLLEDLGFKVKRHAYGLETALSAEYGSGGRVVIFNVEYDALPGIGHACGHNLIATASIAAFLGAVAALKANPDVKGRARLLGTPAEEGGGGKIKLIDAGAYKDADACLMTHPMSGTMFATKEAVAGITYGTCVASTKFRATFTGKPAHAAAAPQEGINALDAAVLAYSGISMLRQQIKDGQRIQGVIIEGGEKPNIITPKAVMDYNVRGHTVKETSALQERVMKCFEGAATATGCTVEFAPTNFYAELMPNRALCLVYSEIMAEMDLPQLCSVDEEPAPGSYSTDQGNVTQVCPGFHPIYTIPTTNGASNHTHEFTSAAATDEAHRLTISTAKGMAGTAWRVLTDDDFAKDMKEEFERDKKAKDH